MFTPGSKPFKAASIYVHNYALPPETESMGKVIECIRCRKDTLEGIKKLGATDAEVDTLRKAWGMDSGTEWFDN